ncbi:hypothetical protein AAY473_032475 [Plecturocebus cupreus]
MMPSSKVLDNSFTNISALAGHGGSRLSSQNFGRSKQANHLRSGVRDQPGQRGETPSLLKIQKVASVAIKKCDGPVAHAYNPSVLGGPGLSIAQAQAFEASLGNMMHSCSCGPGWSAMVRSLLTATCASRVQSLALLPRM